MIITIFQITIILLLLLLLLFFVLVLIVSFDDVRALLYPILPTSLPHVLPYLLIPGMSESISSSSKIRNKLFARSPDVPTNGNKLQLLW